MNTSTAAPSSSSKVTLQYAGSDFPRLSPDELMMLVQRCGLNDRESQKKIYIAFYSFSMAICNRYVNSYDDAVEILNDGFLKIFREIHRFKPAYSDVVASFRGWV
ncbi:MAG TPA: hypothetical protein VFP87_05675, partial [Chitinophagaceae bacterium]|nr:hypothetical protein [Chitinophagaceae bacterium]